MTEGEYKLTLECDAPGCKAWNEVVADTRMAALAQAREAGWMVRRIGSKCLCKPHAEALRESGYRIRSGK